MGVLFSGIVKRKDYPRKIKIEGSGIVERLFSVLEGRKSEVKLIPLFSTLFKIR